MPLRYEQQLLCPDVIAYNARQFADRPAVVSDDVRLSWSELDRRTSQVANALVARGLGKGDKVAQLMRNSVDTFVVFWGTLRAGCCVVPLNALLKGDALARLINDSDAAAIFVDEDTRDDVEAVRQQLTHIPGDGFFTFDSPARGWHEAERLIEAAPDTDPGVRIDPGDSMSILYSSGTTGVPKGIEHTHFARMMYPIGFAMGLAVDRYSVAVIATPAYASASWICMFPAMYRGGTTVIVRKFTPGSYLETVERERATHVFLVPTQWAMLLAEPSLTERDLSSLKAVVSAAQPLPRSIYDGVRRAFPTAGLYDIYGMTEGFATLRIPGDDLRGKRESVGKPFALEDLRIINEDGAEVPAGTTGEICAYGMGMMKCYYRAPHLTEDTIWTSPEGRTFIRSGDMGHLDEDGFLFVSGREKEMIKSGGMNIYAADIEDVFMEHPGVHEASAVGVPHERWGETPWLGIILARGSNLDPEELRAWGNQRLAGYQSVSRVFIREDFPRKTYGKVSKEELRDELLDAVSGAID